MIWRKVLVPAEHGAWAFLAEPLALGLLVAFSPAGVLLALAALALFLARRPLKLLVSDRREGQRYPRTGPAERAFTLLAMAGFALLAWALLAAEYAPLPALALAVPPAVLALALDLSRRSREAAAEIAAALALGALAPAVALAGGWSAPPALALWGVLAARAVPSVLYVRARLRLDRGRPAGVALALVAHAAAIAAVAALALAGLAPWAAGAAMAVLALRAAYGLSPARPRLTTAQLGVSEILLGALVVVSVALGAGR